MKKNLKSMMIFTTGLILGMTIMYFRTSCIIEHQMEMKRLQPQVEKFMELVELDEANEDILYFTE